MQKESIRVERRSELIELEKCRKGDNVDLDLKFDVVRIWDPVKVVFSLGLFFAILDSDRLFQYYPTHDGC